MIQSMKTAIKDNAPIILTISAITGTVLTGIFSFRAGYKVKKVIDKKVKEVPNPTKEEKREIAKEVILESAPSVLASALTIGGTVACNVVNYKNNKLQNDILKSQLAQMTTIASIGASQFKSIKDEIKEELGEKKYNKIRDNAITKKFKEEPEGQHRYILDTGGNVYCCVQFFGIDFTATYDKVNNAIENFAYKIDQEAMCTATEFLDLLHLDFDYIPAADIVFWTQNDLAFVEDNFGRRHPTIPSITTTTILREDRPCLAIVFNDWHVKEF